MTTSRTVSIIAGTVLGYGETHDHLVNKIRREIAG